MRIEVLGPIRVWLGGEAVDLGPTGQRALLGLLTVTSGQPLSRADLVEAVWGDRPPPSATNIIQTRVKNLRRLLEPARQRHGRSAILPAVGDGYALQVPAADIDLHRFRQLTAAAAAAQEQGDLTRAATLMRDALRLWRGRPLADIPFLAMHPKVLSLIEQRRKAMAQYGELMIATGGGEDVLPVLVEAVTDDPLDEGACARLIRAYQAAGRRAEAFDTYHETRRRLADELGIDPGPELTAAHAALLENTGASPTLANMHRAVRPVREPSAVNQAPAVAVGPSARRPVPAQLPADIADFIGRSGQLRQLDELGVTRGRASAGTMLVAVLSGSAGAGKTALAVHWAHQVRERFPDGQLYVNLGGFGPGEPAMEPADVMQGFLDAFGVPAEHMPTSFQALTGLYRSVLAEKQTLIVLDNALDAEQVRPLLPGAPTCAVVVTSRNRLASLVATERAHPLALDLLSAGEARDFMAHRIGPDRVAAERGAVEEIITVCARLPLALAIVAARATIDPRLTLGELAHRLREARSALDALTDEDRSTDVRGVFS
ncbi:MAG: BTAD domain-containing putative transcriptional regulator, partial [Micromonosporaceae bacterium]